MKNKVAALVYFEEGTTTAKAQQALTKLKDQLDMHEMKGCEETAIDYAVVNEYDPAKGGPVWYCP